MRPAWRRTARLGQLIAVLLLTSVVLKTAACAQQPRPGLRRGQGQGRGEEVTGVETFHLEHGGLNRRYLVHVPAGYDGRSPLPVVLAFHGGAGRAESQIRQASLNDLADREKFLAVYPDGTGRAGFLTWNAGTCCGYAVENNVDDVGFVSALIDELANKYQIDPQRIYATGMSNGGMLCYRLACELSDRIAAIAPVAASRGVDGPLPKRPVPVIHFHGLKDPNVLFEGGKGPNQIQPVPHRSNADTIGFFIKANNCQPTPQTERGQDFILERYEPAAGQKGAPVYLYKLPEGGHTWPGGVDTTARFNTGRLIETVPANELIWQFFKQFKLDIPAR